MMILVGKSPHQLLKYRRPNLGLLTSPRIGTYIEGWAEQGGLWAGDNDAFSESYSDKAYGLMLDRYRGVPNCLWVVAPDVVADAEATLDRFHEWNTTIADYGYPIALAGQDGMTPAMVPWIEIDCLFIGGTTHWKLGPEARALALAAKAQGKLVHMGRVNSRRRIKYAKAIGCDSVDGTSTVKFTDTHLPAMLEWAASPQQGLLTEDAP